MQDFNPYPQRPQLEIPSHLSFGTKLAIGAKFFGLYAREFAVTAPLHLTAAFAPSEYRTDHNREIQMHMQRTYCAAQRIVDHYVERGRSPYPDNDAGLPPRHL